MPPTQEPHTPTPAQSPTLRLNPILTVQQQLPLPQLVILIISAVKEAMITAVLVPTAVAGFTRHLCLCNLLLLLHIHGAPLIPAAVTRTVFLR